MKKNLKKGVLWNFILSYSIILTISISFLIFFLATSFHIYTEHILSATSSDLRHRVENLDARFRELNTFSSQFSADERTRQIARLTTPLDDNGYGKLSFLTNQIFGHFQTSNSFFQDFLIYFMDSSIGISPKLSSSLINSTYQSLLTYNGQNFSEISSQLQSPSSLSDIWPAGEIQLLDHRFSAITYVKYLHFDGYIDPKAAVIIFIDKALLLKNLDYHATADGGWLAVLDRDGNLIASQNTLPNSLASLDLSLEMQQQKIDGTNCYLFSYSSEDQMLRYVWGFPKQNLFAGIDFFVKVVFITFLVFLITELAMILVLSQRKSKPITDILEIFSTRNGKSAQYRSEYDFIKDSIGSLFHDNQDLQQQLESQQDALILSFTERLFHADFSSGEEIALNMEFLSLHFSKPCFVVLLIALGERGNLEDIEDLKAVESAKILVQNTLLAAFAGNCLLYNVNTHSLAVLLSLTESSYKEETGRMIDRLRQEVSSYQIYFSVSCSSVFADLLLVGNALKDAKHASSQADSSSSISYYDEIPFDFDTFYYPMETEISIINSVKAGEQNSLCQTLEYLYDRNFVKSVLVKEQMNLLLTEINGTITRISHLELREHEEQQKEVQKQLKSAENCMNPVLIFRKYQDILTLLCEFFRQQREDSKVDLIQQINSYIQQDFANTELCLYSIASHFSLPEKYLSRFYKESTGINLSAYVENLRLNEAARLIQEGNCTIQEISEKCGYLNHNTFYKAFKRKFGVSPSTYSAQQKF